MPQRTTSTKHKVLDELFEVEAEDCAFDGAEGSPDSKVCAGACCMKWVSLVKVIAEQLHERNNCMIASQLCVEFHAGKARCSRF